MQDIHGRLQEGGTQLQRVTDMVSDIPHATAQLQSGIDHIKRDVHATRQECQNQTEKIQAGQADIKEMMQQLLRLQLTGISIQ